MDLPLGARVDHREVSGDDAALLLVVPGLGILQADGHFYGGVVLGVKALADLVVVAEGGDLHAVLREGGREGGREGWISDCLLNRTSFKEGGREGGREGRMGGWVSFVESKRLQIS